MYMIFAKSTGKALCSAGEDYEPIVFSKLNVALAYLNERYTDDGMALWTVEKLS